MKDELCAADGCNSLKEEGSKYCPIHKPMPADKYADRNSEEYKRWRKENPRHAQRLEEVDTDE